MIVQTITKPARLRIGAAVITMLLGSSCAFQEAQKPLAPPLDDNALKIIQHVKSQPSVIRGGGTIYELFAGERFNARYDEKLGKLILTDIVNDSFCEYGADGKLVVPAHTGTGYIQYCIHLSTNTVDFIEQ